MALRARLQPLLNPGFGLLRAFVEDMQRIGFGLQDTLTGRASGDERLESVRSFEGLSLSQTTLKRIELARTPTQIQQDAIGGGHIESILNGGQRVGYLPGA